MKPEYLHILRHSLGYDDAGNGREYRNRYVSHPTQDLIDLCSMGLLKDCGAFPVFGDMHGYMVTVNGRAVVQRHVPEPAKLTKSESRYRRWLNAHCGLTFGAWLKYQKNFDPAELQTAKEVPPVAPHNATPLGQ